MKTLIKSVVVVLLVQPSMIFATTNCRVTEYPDHYEAVCIGDEQAGPLQKQAPVQTPPVHVATPEGTQTVEAAKSSDAQQSNTMNQEFNTVPNSVTSKTPGSSQKDVDNASPVQTRRTTRTTAMESAIAARRQLILDQQ